MIIYEYEFGVHYKAIPNKTLSKLLGAYGMTTIDFTEDEFNEFRVQLQLMDIEICEIARRVKMDLEAVL